MTDKNNNNRQDVSIARLEEKFNAFEKRFDDFVNNHFKSFKEEIRRKVSWNRNLIVLSILVPIFLFTLTTLFGI